MERVATDLLNEEVYVKRLKGIKLCVTVGCHLRVKGVWSHCVSERGVRWNVWRRRIANSLLYI